ncbi:hypothetical protein F5884DRAFT_758127 [Xylogone sp. PMI_703]|nr:hypothetical protein F5884DRAFT_758127 [Xylogone sp. PMI_703]
MDLERRTYRSSRHFTASQSSIGNPEHTCFLCGKRRSSTYRKLHPLTPGQAPEPGICSRPQCVKAVNEMQRHLPHRLVVYEIHHHYHFSAGSEGPPPGYTATEAQFPDDALCWTRHGSLSPIREESSPINTSYEPEEHASNSSAIELSGESSLGGRVEMPDNRPCSRRHVFRRLSPIPEESPPPVNFVQKPKWQKK